MEKYYFLRRQKLQRKLVFEEKTLFDSLSWSTIGYVTVSHVSMGGSMILCWASITQFLWRETKCSFAESAWGSSITPFEQTG